MRQTFSQVPLPLTESAEMEPDCVDGAVGPGCNLGEPGDPCRILRRLGQARSHRVDDLGAPLCEGSSFGGGRPSSLCLHAETL